MGLLDDDDQAYLKREQAQRVARVIELHPSAWEVVDALSHDNNPVTDGDPNGVIEVAIYMMAMIRENPNLMVEMMKHSVMDGFVEQKYGDQIRAKIRDHEDKTRRN